MSTARTTRSEPIPEANRVGAEPIVHDKSPPLRHFRELNLWLKTDKRPDISKDTVAKLFVSHARLKVAKRFDGVRMRRASQNLIRGYTAGMRLLLCYSAAESMGEAIGEKVTTWEITDEPLLVPLRRLAAPLPDRSDILHKHIREQVANFIFHKHDNIRVVATALRHLMAHGHFTPTGAGAMTNAGSDAIETLSKHLVAETERRFAEWFNKIHKAATTTAGKSVVNHADSVLYSQLLALQEPHLPDVAII